MKRQILLLSWTVELKNFANPYWIVIHVIFQKDFAYSCELFAKDGLHLNSNGKYVLAFSFHYYLLESFSSKKKTISSPVVCRRIPKELKILHPPRKCKVHKKTWQETNLDLVLYLRRERQSTKCPCSRRKPRRQRERNPARGPDRDGFVKPRSVISVPPPLRGCDCHQIGMLVTIYPCIYVNLDTHSKEWSGQSKCPIPAPVKPFNRRKRLGKRKRRQRANGRRKRRK